jgi:hypothetical protein
VLFDSIVLLRTRYWFGMDIGMACSDFRILRRYTNSNTDSDSDSDSDSNTNAYSDTYPNSDTNSYANTYPDSYSTWFTHVCRLRQLMEHQYR